MLRVCCAPARWTAILFGLMVLLAQPETTYSAELRTWMAAQGDYRVEAEFVALKPGEIASLKTKDGRLLDVPLAQLSAADQEYARRQAAATTPAATGTAGANPRYAKTERAADRCRTPGEALVVFQIFIDDPNTTDAERATARARIAEYKQLQSEKKVRLNKKWVTEEEAAGVRRKADDAMRQGLELLKLKQEDAFKRKFNEAALLEPDEIRADFIAASIYTLGRQSEKALAILQRCLARDPENTAVLNNIAMLSAAKGDWATMSTMWRKALSVQPDQRIVHNIGRLLAQATEANVKIPRGPRDALSLPYTELVATGKFQATDPAVGWLYLLIEQSDLDLSLIDDEKKADGTDSAATKPARPEATEDGVDVGGGTGFVIHPGYVLTNAHVAVDDAAFEIQTSDGTRVKATRVAKAPNADLAVLKCEELTAPALTLASDIAPRGTDIMLLGFPEMFNLGATLKATRGSISGIPDAQVNDMYLYDAVTNSGNSGGPVCDDRGNVVAVHAAGVNTASRYGSGVPSVVARKFLTTVLPEAQAVAAITDKLDWPGVDAKVSPSTVLIWVRKKDGAPQKTNVSTNALELPLCIFCGGAKKVRCTAAGCVNGRATAGGRTRNCRTCNGRDEVRCEACAGQGLDRELIAAKAAIKQAAEDKARAAATAARRAATASTRTSSTRGSTTTGGPPPGTTTTGSTMPGGASGVSGRTVIIGPGTPGDPDSIASGYDDSLKYDPGIRAKATVQLAPADIERLKLAIAEGKFYDVRSAANELCTAIPDPASQADIAKLLEGRVSDKEQHWLVQTDCCRALAYWRRPETSAVVQAALRDKTYAVRRQAANTIVHTADVGAVAKLVESFVAPEAINGDPSLVNINVDRSHFMRCLIAFGQPARTEVEKIKEHVDPRIRGAAIHILARYDGLPATVRSPGSSGN